MDEETIEMYVEQSQNMSLDFILRSLDILNKSENQAKWATQPRIILEMAAIKLVNLEEQISLEERVKKLEMMISSGEVTRAKPKTAKVEKKLIRQKEKPIEEIEPTQIFDDGKELAFEKIKNEWQKILKIIKDKKINTYALLMEGKLISFTNNNLHIGYQDGFGFHKDAISRPENKEYVEKVLSSYFNKSIRVNFIMEDEQIIEKTEKKEEKDDTIQEVIDFFGKDIVEIK